MQGKYEEAQPYLESAGDRSQGPEREPPLYRDGLQQPGSGPEPRGKYPQARDLWIHAAHSFESARLTAAFTGLDRATATTGPRIPLAAVLARLGQPAEAWQYLEEDLGRGLLDEPHARHDTRLTTQERDQLQQRIAELERLDRLFEAPMTRLDQAQRAQHLEELRVQRDRAQVALGDLRSQLARKYDALAGRVARLPEIQSALPSDVALVAWIDITPSGPRAADPSGEHWGIVVRANATPTWIRLQGTGQDHQWTDADTRLTTDLRTLLAHRPGPNNDGIPPLIQRLRADTHRASRHRAASRARLADRPPFHQP